MEPWTADCDDEVGVKRASTLALTGVAVIVASCAAPSPTIERTSSAGPTAAAGPTATHAVTSDAYEAAECPGNAVVGIGLPVTCGYLTVPEDRGAASTRQVRLLVVRVSPLKDPSPDPMITLGFDVPWTTNYPGVAPMASRTHREVIMLALRGSGRSEPSLVCTELEDLADSPPPLGDDPAQVVDLAPRVAFMGAVRACHDRLVGEGVNLAAYDLTESAADVDDLRAALEIDEFNLVTYGTTSRIAFEVMRRYPEHLRSVILDTPSVPQADMFTEAIVGTRASLAALFSACRADSRCDAAYPDLDAAMATAMARLAANPIQVTSDGHALLLDDVTVLRWMRSSLADHTFPQMPASIQLFADDSSNGPGAAAREIGMWPILSHGYVGEGWPDLVSPGSFHGDFSHGLLYSLACHDHLPYMDRDALIEATDGEPWYRKAYLDSPFGEICDVWDVDSGDGTVVEPVKSSIPTLLLVGQFDPFGVGTLVREAARSLDTSWVIEFPLAHNVLGYGEECPREIRNAWVDAPTSGPDTTCVGLVPPVVFAIP